MAKVINAGGGGAVRAKYIPTYSPSADRSKRPDSNAQSEIDSRLTLAQIKAQFKALLLEYEHPISSFYITLDINDLPSARFGGGWVRASAAFLVGYSPGDPVFGYPGWTGGTRDAQVIYHQHAIGDYSIYVGTNANNTAGVTTQYGNFAAGTIARGLGAVSAGASQLFAFPQGVGGGNLNLPPYLVVCMWYRVS